MFGIGYEWRDSVVGGKFLWDCAAIEALRGLLVNSFGNCRRFRIGDDGANWALHDGHRYRFINDRSCRFADTVIRHQIKLARLV